MIVKDELMAMFVRKKSLPRNNGGERQARFKIYEYGPEMRIYVDILTYLYFRRFCRSKIK